MTARDTHNQVTGMRLQKRCWIALPTALLANIFLFYVLAGARTTPPREHVSEMTPARIAVMDMPSLDAAKPEIPQSKPDLIPAAIKETAADKSETIPEATTVWATRLPDGIDAVTSELSGLPVVLPGLSDLRSLPGAPVSEITGPLSLATVDRAPGKTTGGFPRYPQWARRARLEGTVTLRFVVTPEGAVTNVNIHRLEGDERFGREAMRAIATWRFDPATKRGRPVACWCFQKVNFKLDN